VFSTFFLYLRRGDSVSGGIRALVHSKYFGCYLRSSSGILSNKWRTTCLFGDQLN